MTTSSNSMAHFIPKSNISFNGGDLSSDTGSMLLLDFIFNNNLLDPFSSLPFNEDRAYFQPHNSNFSLFKQIICRDVLGYSCQSDQQVLAQDPILKNYFPQVSSQSSVSRFLDRVTEETNNALSTVFMDQYCGWINKNIQNPIFDMDSSKTDTYGRQECAAWIHHYQQIGYHPVMVNEYNSKMLAASFLRPGSTYSGDEAVSVMEEVLSRISDDYQGESRTVKFRGDAAFFNGELMDLFESRNCPVSYAIRARNSEKLVTECVNDYYSKEHKEDYLYTSSDPFYGEILYQMTDSDKPRRVCYKISFSEEEKKDKKGNVQISLIPHIFAVITNDMTSSVEEVILFYCQRGASENFTKELKDDFDANTLSHEAFTANAMEFFQKSIAYNLFHMFQWHVLEGADRKMKAESFRRKYQKVASRISRHARSFYLRIANSFSSRQAEF